MYLCIVQGRKDELIRKHYEKLGKWKEMLADAQVAPQHPSTARASRSHIIQPYISYLISSSLFSAGPGAPAGPVVGPGGQTPHGSFVPGNTYPRMAATQVCNMCSV